MDAPSAQPGCQTESSKSTLSKFRSPTAPTKSQTSTSKTA